jgi:hypothetical protein
MFIKRMAAIQKRGRTELEEIRERHRAELERLWGVFGDVLHGAREALSVEKEAAAPREPDRDRYERAGRLMLDALEQAGGVEQVSTDHAAISAHHGNNHVPLLERHFRSHRATLFGLLEALQLESTSVDRSVLDAVEFIVAHRQLNRDQMPDQVNGEPLNLSFASEKWLKMVQDRHRPGQLVRRHLEVCVFCYLADELRTGDVAVVGADAYANYLGQLMSWEECEPLVAGYCAQAGLPATAEEFVAGLRQELTEVAARVDAGYPDNADLVIDENGHPMLKRRRGRDRRASAIALERLVEDRMPERSVLDVLTRTAFWLRWHRHFGPLSGSDPKLADPLARYVMIAFTYGTNMGPYQASRRAGQSARDLSASESAHHLGQAQPRFHGRHQLVLTAGRDQALGRRLTGCSRRQADRHLVGQPAGREQHPLWRLRRPRPPARLRHLHRPLLPLRPLRRVGGGLRVRRSASEPE